MMRVPRDLFDYLRRCSPRATTRYVPISGPAQPVAQAGLVAPHDRRFRSYRDAALLPGPLDSG